MQTAKWVQVGPAIAAGEEEKLGDIGAEAAWPGPVGRFFCMVTG
jgi:hypothetical protein